MKIRTYSALLFCFLAFAVNAKNTDYRQVEKTLDTLHSAAAAADWDAYFGVYHDDAIFIGTDATETWTMAEFKTYAKPAFERGTGWTYHSYDRHIYFSPDNQVAWFDEMLSNQSLGTTRGTGVLVKTDSGWKVMQYHLVIPVPNDIADDVAEQIQRYQKKQKQQ